MKSLEEVHQSVDTTRKSGFGRFFLFAGPAFMVCVGYMDPGNWATDIAGGSQFGYKLIWVLLMSNLIALLLQSLSARLGIVRGVDLAQASRQTYPSWINGPLWILAEIAIAATDLAEVLGMAIGLHLLFQIPIFWGVSIAILDTFLIFYLQKKGIRYMELFIFSLVFVIAVSFLVQIMLAAPAVSDIAGGLLPSSLQGEALYIAIGIIGATVMPHNLYLHSALVQTRRSGSSAESIRESIRYNFWDSALALNLAFFVNAAILILAATVFFKNGLLDVARMEDAHRLLEPLLGAGIAPYLFAVALIAAGQSSTVTGTLAGQIIMEGYLDLRITPWLRRLITRSLAVIPALITIGILGESSVDSMLVFSQVILSLQLGFAVIPLIHFVSDKQKMGEFAIRPIIQMLSWVSALIIVLLNIRLVWSFVEAMPVGIPQWLAMCCLAGSLLLLLATFIYPLLRRHDREVLVSEGRALQLPVFEKRLYGRVAVCVDFREGDVRAIGEAVAMCAAGGQLLLIHVVESATARSAGVLTADRETKHDQEQLANYQEQLMQRGVSASCALGFGKPSVEIARLAADSEADLLVIAGHGHRGFFDLLYGETINDVRHRLQIPVLVV
jgi:manganese transport protein